MPKSSFVKSHLHFLLAIIFCSLGLAQDFEAPMITSISLTPNVDVTSGDQVITATVQITDDDSGFEFGNLFLYRPDGNFVSSHAMGSFQMTGGDSLDGTYEVEITIPRYAPAGSWEIRSFVEDSASNVRDYGGTDDAFPVPSEAFFTVVNSGTVDNAPPALVSVSVSPGTIDTGSISQSIAITLNITDSLSGLRSASLYFKDPNSDSQFNISGFVFYTQVSSGDAQDGVYVINSTIPQGSLDGTWTFDVFLSDQVGNRTTIPEPAGATFEVSNTSIAAIGDLSDATDATQFNWTPAGDQDWFPQSTVTSDGVDAAQSGAIGDGGFSDLELLVTGPGTLNFEWKVDSEAEFDVLSVEVLNGGDFDSISGDVDWSASSVTIPPGLQTVRFRYEKDGSSSEGQDAGWIDRVCFIADVDSEEPVIQRLSLTPNPVNIANGYVEVTVTIEVSDDSNGFSDGYLYLTEVATDNEYVSGYFDSSNLISGDSNCGTYEVTFDFYADDFNPEGGGYLEGTYRISAEVIESGTGNTRYYGNGDDPFPIPGTEFFTVGGAPTGSAPYLTGIAGITPGVIDITTEDQLITVEFGVISNSIGFSFGDVSLFNPSGDFVQSFFFDGSDRISGNDLNGVYSVTVPVYQHSEPGTWTVHFYLSDYDDNTREYPFDTFYPVPGDEEFTVINGGSVDTTVPVLTAFSLSQTVVDTSAGSQSISVDFSLTDDLSGIQSVALYAYDPGSNFAGGLYQSFPTSGLLSDTYSGTFDLPAGSLEGVWNAVLSVSDRAGNSFFYVAGSPGFGSPFPAPFIGQFTVGPVSQTSFSSFTSSYGLTGLDALGGANSDGDLFNNAMEFLLGLDPTVANAPDPLLYEVVRSGNEIWINFTVDPSLAVSVSGTSLSISKDGAAPVLVTGQTGANLRDDWVDQAPVNVGGSKYRVILPITASQNGMIRLRFSIP